MDPSSPPLKVEFEHRRPLMAEAGVAFGQPGTVVTNLNQRVLRRVQVVRAVVAVLGAAGLAWGTQALGLSLGAGLCAFLGALPVLWVVGWLVGFAFGARQALSESKAALERGDWKAELDAQLVKERVRLEVSELGLRITRQPKDEPEVSELVGWTRVGLTRHGTEAAMIILQHQPFLPVQVPASAFADAAAFDAFCLAVQGHVWAAQRR